MARHWASLESQPQVNHGLREDRSGDPPVQPVDATRDTFPAIVQLEQLCRPRHGGATVAP